jgi:hypothetical protein
MARVHDITGIHRRFEPRAFHASLKLFERRRFHLHFASAFDAVPNVDRAACRTREVTRARARFTTSIARIGAQRCFRISS